MTDLDPSGAEGEPQRRRQLPPITVKPQTPRANSDGKGIFLVVLGTLVLLLVVGAVASNTNSSTSRPSQIPIQRDPAPPVARDVTYESGGSASRGAMTMITPSGTSQVTRTVPHSSTHSGFRSGDFLYVSVQNQGDSGSISCAISAGGRVLASNRSSGAYAIVTCEARMP